MLLDLSLGDADGFEVLTEFRAAYPALPVVVVSASDRTSDVIRAIDLGAMGFVPKRSSNDMLFEALRMVMSGGIYVPPMMLGAGRRRRPEGDTVPDVTAPGGRPGTTDAGYQQRSRRSNRWASRRARPTCSALLLQGKPNKLIARELNAVGRDRQGPRGRGAARAGRQLAHPGGAGGEPDAAAGGAELRASRREPRHAMSGRLPRAAAPAAPGGAPCAAAASTMCARCSCRRRPR